MQNCPQASKWAISVWDGNDDTETAQALATCGAVPVAAAYYLVPEDQTWQRWFAGRPEVSNLETLNGMQGVIALGAVGAPAPSPTPTPTPPPTPTPTPTPTPSPSPTAGQGLSRGNPVPRGVPVVVPEGWEITVLDFIDDAWPLVEAENMFNDPPEPGYRMVIVRVRGKNVSAEDPADFDAEFALRLVGSANVTYTTFDRSCGVIPDDFTFMSTEVWRGGDIQGNVCFQVRQDENDFVLFTHFFLSDEDDRRWFAVH